MPAASYEFFFCVVELWERTGGAVLPAGVSSLSAATKCASRTAPDGFWFSVWPVAPIRPPDFLYVRSPTNEFSELVPVGGLQQPAFFVFPSLLGRLGGGDGLLMAPSPVAVSG